MTFKRVFTAKVIAVEEKTRALAAVLKGHRVDEHGQKFPVWEVPRESIGWFVSMEGSRESLFVGTDRPDLEAGHTLEVTLRRVT